MTSKSKVFLGKIALVTGATSPLGQAIALRLAAEGANIVAHYHNSKDEAKALGRKIRDLGRTFYSLQADFAKEREAGSLIPKVIKIAGTPDILINNASIFPHSTLRSLDYSDFLNTMQINAWAPIVLSREFARRVRHGAIVNLLDSRIIGGDPEHAGYIISKQVLAAATRMMAIECAPTVRVNAVAPGLVLIHRRDRSMFKRLSRKLPLQKYADPEDVADAVAFLSKSASITGQTIFVDNGRRMRENAG
jgi:pteridine reductase